jgi:predicted ArsR family transcriptional regulator
VKIPTEAGRRVAQSLLTHGPATAAELAERLEMTPAGVRRHLDALEADGLLQAGERPAFGPSPVRGRGRPPRVYSVSEAGRDVFDQAYDDLAVAAMRFLRQQGGDGAVQAFARSRAADLERRYRPLVARQRTPVTRAEALAAALTQDGYAASVKGVPGTALALQICQHNCPVAHVATEFPALCASETEAISNLLGTHVTRIATIAHGDGVCTAVVSDSGSTASPPASPGESKRRRVATPASQDHHTAERIPS